MFFSFLNILLNSVLILILEFLSIVTLSCVGLGTHLDLTSFVVKVNNQGIYYNIEIGSHFTYVFDGIHTTETNGTIISMSS